VENSLHQHRGPWALGREEKPEDQAQQRCHTVRAPIHISLLVSYLVVSCAARYTSGSPPPLGPMQLSGALNPIISWHEGGWCMPTQFSSPTPLFCSGPALPRARTRSQCDRLRQQTIESVRSLKPSVLHSRVAHHRTQARRCSGAGAGDPVH
jgi:hypothetical protein